MSGDVCGYHTGGAPGIRRVGAEPLLGAPRAPGGPGARRGRPGERWHGTPSPALTLAHEACAPTCALADSLLRSFSLVSSRPSVSCTGVTPTSPAPEKLSPHLRSSWHTHIWAPVSTTPRDPDSPGAPSAHLPVRAHKHLIHMALPAPGTRSDA